LNKKENKPKISKFFQISLAAALAVMPLPFDRAYSAPGSVVINTTGEVGIEKFKMQRGDSAYLDIQEFAENRDIKEQFNLAYRKGYALWKIDFARELVKYFKTESKYAVKDKNEVLTEIVLSPERYQKLSDLVSKLQNEFSGLGYRVTETIEADNKYLNVLLTDNKLIRFESKDESYNAVSVKKIKPRADRESKNSSDGKFGSVQDEMWIYSSAESDNAVPAAAIDPEIEKKLNEKISFNVTNRPIWEALEGFLRGAELDATVSHDIQGSLTLYIKESTVKKVLEHICKSYGLKYTISDKIIEIKQSEQQQTETIIAQLKNAKANDVNNIISGAKTPAGNIIIDKKTNSLIIKDTPASIQNLKKMIEAIDTLNASDKVTTKLISLSYSDAAKMKTMLQQTLTPEIGAMEVDSRTNMLIVTDVESNIAKIESIVKKLDTPKTTSKIIQCKYVASDDLKTTLNASLKTVLGVTNDNFLIESDKTTNNLIVTASAINLKKIEDFVAQLDVRTKQVLIEARIVQVNLSKDENMGVNWSRLIQGNGSGQENSVNLKTFAPVGDDGIGGITYKVGTLSTDQLRMVMQSLQKKDNSKVIASPTIVTANRKKAYVNVETTYPVRRETVVTTNTGPVTSVTYEKQNVSVRLEVTPAINPDGYVAMEVYPKVQGLAGKVDNTQPIVSTKETSTNIVIKNGHTIVIAGLIEEENSQSDTNIPVLSRIPGISKLFKNETSTSRKNETIIFITPRIVESGIGSPDSLTKKNSGKK